jgi:hypothetical protein
MPGIALYNVIFLKKMEIEERIPYYFLFSLIVLSPVIYFGYFLHWDAGFLVFIFKIVLLLILFTDLIVSFVRQTKKSIKQIESHNVSEGRNLNKMIRMINAYFKSKKVFLTLLLLAVLISAISYFVGIHIGNDAQIHIAIIRKMVDLGIDAKNPFFKDLGILPIYTYALWQPIIALISKVNALDPLRVWQDLSILVAPLALFASYFFAVKLFNNKKIALVCAILFTVFLVFLGFAYGNGRDLRTIVYPRNIDLFILIPIFFGLFFEFFNNRSKKINWLAMIIISVCGALLFYIHMFYFVLVNLGLLSFMIFYLLLRSKSVKKNHYIEIKKYLLLLGGQLLLIAPLVVVQAQISLFNPSIISAHNIIKGRTDILSLGNSWFMVRPHIFYPGVIYWGMVSLLSSFVYLILTPLLAVWYLKKDWAIFLISLMLVTPIICFNPLLVKFFGGIIGLPKVARIYQIAPIFYVSGFFIWLLIRQIFKNSKKIFYQLSLALMAILILALPFREGIDRLKPYAKIKNNQLLLSKNISDFLNTLPKESVISSEANLSRNVIAVSSNYVIVVPNASGFFGTDLVFKRKYDQIAILDQKVEMKETLDLLAKYQAKYILTFIKNVKFDQNNNFKLVYQDKKFKIFKIQKTDHVINKKS